MVPEDPSMSHASKQAVGVEVVRGSRKGCRSSAILFRRLTGGLGRRQGFREGLQGLGKRWMATRDGCSLDVSTFSALDPFFFENERYFEVDISGMLGRGLSRRARGGGKSPTGE